MFFKKAKKLFDFADINTRMRGFILDTQLTDAHEIAEILGASFISDEVAEREEEESDKRLDKINYLVPLMYAHIRILTEGATEYQKATISPSVEIPDELWDANKAQVEKISMAAVQGIISQLVDIGLLELPKKYR